MGVGLRLMECYLEQGVYVVLVLRIGGQMGDVAALIKRDTRVNAQPFEGYSYASDSRQANAHRGESSVLNQVVELVEPPEGIPLSSVRLQSLDLVSNALPHSAHLALVSGYVAL